MPNLYVTPTEIKNAIPDGIRAATTKYDAVLLQLAQVVSRFVDRHCRRVFFPSYGIRYFNGPTERPYDELWIDELVELDAIAISEDGGATYTTLASTDYIKTVAGDFNDARSWTLLAMDVNGTKSSWPSWQRSVKITGWWGYADNRDEAWDASGLTLAAGYTAGGTSLTVADVTPNDRWGLATALHAGRLVRIDDELLEVTSVTNNTAPGNDAATVIGARNGSTAANHLSAAGISLWRPPEPVKQACVIQAVRQVERGFQGFGDARASPDLGQVMFIKALDPEAAIMLSNGYRREGVG